MQHSDVMRDMHCYNRHVADRRPDRDTIHYYERHAVDGVTRDIKYTHTTDREGRERSRAGESERYAKDEGEMSER